MTFKYFFFVCSSGVLATVYCCATSKVQNILAISEAVMGLLKMVLQSHTNTALWKDEAVLILFSYWLKWLKCVLMGQQIPLFFFHWQKLDLANVPVDPEASPFDLLVEMCLEQEGAFLSALCGSGGWGQCRSLQPTAWGKAFSRWKEDRIARRVCFSWGGGKWL